MAAVIIHNYHRDHADLDQKALNKKLRAGYDTFCLQGERQQHSHSMTIESHQSVLSNVNRRFHKTGGARLEIQYNN